MGLFGRKKPIHWQLADAAGITLDGPPTAQADPGAAPFGWTAGIHGVPRHRRWDAVVAATAAGLHGNEVHFVALPDGTIVVDEDEPDGALVPLADALETQISPPYRAEAVRREHDVWAVAGRRIAVATDAGLDGERAELVMTAEGSTLTVDGEQRVARAPGLTAAGEREGAEYVVRASRLDGDLWEVEVSPL